MMDHIIRIATTFYGPYLIHMIWTRIQINIVHIISYDSYGPWNFDIQKGYL